MALWTLCVVLPWCYKLRLCCWDGKTVDLSERDSLWVLAQQPSKMDYTQACGLPLRSACT
jgi:hypothetical protein